MFRTSRIGWVIIALLVCASAPALSAADDPAVLAVNVHIETEKALLATDLEQYDRLARQRRLAMTKLVELHGSLDGALRSNDTAAAGQVERLTEEIADVEARRRALLTREQIVVERVQERRLRIELLSAQVALLEGRPGKPAGALEGTWDIVLLPIDQKGTFRIEQTGTILGGTYRLDGGWEGSLQGTLVKRKVYLVRIDSKLGRSMEFEGYLSGDGKQIRGTWLNYELGDGDGATGHWSARKRSAEG